MTTPWWISLIIALCSGLLSGCISPFIVGWISKKQKKFDLKYNAFSEALTALSKWESDIYDTKLQNEKESYDGISPVINIRPETRQAIENAKSLVKSWFSEESNLALDSVLRSDISLKKVPNLDHEDLRNKFILSTTKELKIK
jgi:hypothetical protein